MIFGFDVCREDTAAFYHVPLMFPNIPMMLLLLMHSLTAECALDSIAHERYDATVDHAAKAAENEQHCCSNCGRHESAFGWIAVAYESKRHAQDNILFMYSLLIQGKRVCEWCIILAQDSIDCVSISIPMSRWRTRLPQLFVCHERNGRCHEFISKSFSKLKTNFYLLNHHPSVRVLLIK